VKILFVCRRNRIRSLMAEHHLAGRPGRADSETATAPSARVRLTAGHPSRRSRAGSGWADVVVVMEKRRQEQVAARFGDEVAGKRSVCLHIPDDYAYGDEELLDLIETGAEPLVEPTSVSARAVTL